MIKAEHISKSIEVGDKTEHILRDISFELDKNTITAIVGKSGCGKSTLLSILSGIDEPSGGKVYLDKKDYYDMDRKEQEKFRNENIGILFQNYHLIPELTCEENIRMPLVFSDKKAESGRVKKMMKSVGLEKQRRLYPKQMSGGEQQRTAIVRALINKPNILYADEPTGSVILVQHYPKQIPVMFPSLSTFISSMTDRQRVRFSSRVKVSYIALKSAVKIFLMAAKSGGASCAGSGSCPSAAVYIS